MKQEELITSLHNLNTNKDSTTWDYRTQQLAPHKPFLLLSILDGIRIGWIERPKITLSQDLIEIFFRYWNQIMGKDRNTTIALPFFHMKSEPFWKLQYTDGAEPYSNSPSLGGLLKRVAFAKIDDQLFQMMFDDEGRQIITKVILNSYFSEEVGERIKNIHQINIGAYQYAHQLELMAAEPFEKYHADSDNSDYSFQKSQQRQYGFGLKVRQNYEHRCAVCRTRVKTPNGESLVEGAHIIPWSESKNNDPRNGLALCKTHHWMFDAYLLTVKPDFQIKLSTWLKEESEEIEQTLTWDREEILLPKAQQYFPSELALEEHYQEFESAG